MIITVTGGGNVDMQSFIINIRSLEIMFKVLLKGEIG